MILLIVLGVTGVFGLIVYLLYRYMIAVSSLMMDSKENDKETIIHTGRVPRRWVKRKVENRLPIVKKWLKGRCLRRLNKLIRHYSHTTLVSSNAERKFIIKALQDVREAWKQEELEDIMQSSDPFSGPYVM